MDQESSQVKLPKILQAHLHNKSFHHAYLFVGPKSSSKKLVAQNFSSQIFEQMNWLPELIEFDFAGGSKLEELRELINTSWLTGQGGGKRVVVFYNFEQATPAAASALLKTIEEPAQSTLLILIANQARILPTIMSRCLVLRFNSVLGDELDLTRELSNEDYVKFTATLKAGLAERLLSIPTLSGLATEHLTALLTLWLNSQKKQLGLTSSALSNCRLAQETINDLGSHRNIKFVLQDFFFKIKI